MKFTYNGEEERNQWLEDGEFIFLSGNLWYGNLLEMDEVALLPLPGARIPIRLKDVCGFEFLSYFNPFA